MIARAIVSFKKTQCFIFLLCFSFAVQAKIVTFLELEILEKTAQGQGVLKDINKYEDNVISIVDGLKARVVESEKEIAQLSREHEERKAAAKKSETKMIKHQQESLQKEAAALSVAAGELSELQNHFFLQASKAKDLIDQQYAVSTMRFYKNIFSKYAPQQGWDIVVSKSPSSMITFSSSAVDVTGFILKNLKKQSDVQGKKFTTIQEVKSLFADLGLVYLEKNIIPSGLLSAIAESTKEFQKENVAFTSRGLSLYGDSIAQGKRAPMSVSWVSDKVGWGVFAAKDILEGEFIQEYTGVVLAEEPGKPMDTTYAWKLFKSGNNLLMSDAKDKGNEMRFVNHSNHPNVACHILVGRDNQFHACYIASGFIKAGEQLFVSYGKDYWNDRNYFEELFD